ncbi:MAG: exodeoxyribonuclease VII small subunit [Saprospiraceae bacterium]|nr:exodeoxyribonuclease VII small subunit [Saprospiraceae bacterium]MDW8482963.1 exodeoxyribonuclease VII small subunit [Saprospiraceae bacterium]
MKQIDSLPRTYEEAYEELQQILTALQQEGIRIDDLAVYVERAKQLIQFCRARLRQVEERLQQQEGENINP